jgi:hypothetical protein
MFGRILKHSLATVAVGAGLLAYDGHAALGASVYQHNANDLEFLAVSPQGPPRAANITDGPSNTVAFGERAAAS